MYLLLLSGCFLSSFSASEKRIEILSLAILSVWIAIAVAEQLPEVSISSPANNAVVSGNLDIIVNYSIDNGNEQRMVG